MYVQLERSTLLSVLLPPNGPIQSRSQEHNGNLPSQEGHGGEKTEKQHVKKKQKSAREKSLHVAMIKIPTHDINSHLFASFINNGHMYNVCSMYL